MESVETTSPEVTAEASSEATAPEMTTETTETVESPATYANGKYNSVGDLENAYSELQSTFSKKLGAFEGSPEAYEFSEGFVTEDNQGLADMISEWGKENQLSNDGINSLIGKYNEASVASRESAINAEFAKLGEDGTTRINNARSFLEANLGEDATKALAGNMNTAGAIEAIEKLIGMTKAPKVAETTSNAFVNKEKTDAMRFAIDDNGNRKMEDPAYRAMVLKLESNL